jgi:hypothetical protein
MIPLIRTGGPGPGGEEAGAGALHPGPGHRPEPRQPAQQVTVPGQGGRKLRHSQQPADRIQRGRHVNAQMRVHPARHRARRDIDVQVRVCAARHRAHGIYDGHRHPFRLPDVKGWHRRPTARRRCDRPVGAGRSTALRASAGATPPGPGRRIVLNTGTPSTDSRAKPDPGEADGTPSPAAKAADCHRSPSLRHSRSRRRSASLHILPAEYALYGDGDPCRGGAPHIGRLWRRAETGRLDWRRP